MKLILAAALAANVCGIDGAIDPPRPLASETCPACEALDRFYAAREGRMAWTGPIGAGRFAELLDALRTATAHGLDPDDYELARLEASRPERADRLLDEAASRAWLTLAHDLAHGRLAPRTIEPGWTLPRREIDLAARLERALEFDAIAESLALLAPQDDGYRTLQRAYRGFLALAQKGGWPAVSAGPALHPGDRSGRVEQLRARLEATGHVSRQVAASERSLFDADMADAVLRIQQEAHLEDDGIAGEAFLAWLAVPADYRARQLAANLERRRWRHGRPDMQAGLGRSLRVNIPDFTLDVLEDSSVAEQYRVIVGRLSRPTPVFSAQLRYIVLNPWWETPNSLAVRDELPVFRRDPDAVERLGFQVLDGDGMIVDPVTIDWDEVPSNPFPYRLRQAPGPLNALGQVKFIFPNPHNTYLHDTPARELFAHSVRAFSSGCMRVERPVDLAHWVTAGLTGWTDKHVDAALAAGQEMRVDMDTPIPVDVVYWTAIPEGRTGIRLVADLYAKDDIIITALSGGSLEDQE